MDSVPLRKNMMNAVNLGGLVLLVIVAIAGADTPPGIAKNPSNARCLDDKYKTCHNLVHVCPKFCPDSCTVDCQSCKPICGPGSSPPPTTPPYTPPPSSPPPPTPPTPTPSPSPPPPSSPPPTPTPPTPSPSPPPPSSPPPTPTPPTPTPSPSPPPSSPPPPSPTPPTPSPSPSPTPPSPSPSQAPPPENASPPSTPTPTPPSPAPSTPPSTPPASPPPSTPSPAPSTPPSTPPASPPPSTPSPAPSTPPSTPPASPPPSTPSPSPSTPPASPPPSTPSPAPSTPPSTPPASPPPSTPSPAPSTPPASPPPSTPSPAPSTPPPTPPASPPPSTPSPPTPYPPSETDNGLRRRRCRNKNYPQCYGVDHVCPAACPNSCEVNCVTCKPVCKCDMPGAVCQDPRFIGGDGITFYFHGKKDRDFCLVTDPKLHINAHFIGRRNQNMRRDFTWVQSIAVIFGNHHLFLGAKKTAAWDDAVDRLSLSLDGEPIALSTAEGTTWKSAALPTATFTRDSDTNSIVIEVEGLVKISARVVPITPHESRVHNYGITGEDCFAHLELGFKFLSLNPNVNGVLGQTYGGNYVSRVKMGVAMPVLGGDKEFAVSNIFATDCAVSQFHTGENEEAAAMLELPSMKCGTGSGGRGVVCKK